MAWETILPIATSVIGSLGGSSGGDSGGIGGLLSGLFGGGSSQATPVVSGGGAAAPHIPTVYDYRGGNRTGASAAAQETVQVGNNADYYNQLNASNQLASNIYPIWNHYLNQDKPLATAAPEEQWKTTPQSFGRSYLGLPATV